jgi:hypothetical protein
MDPEDDRLSASPVLVENVNAVFGLDRVHRGLPLLCAWSSPAIQPPSWIVYCRVSYDVVYCLIPFHRNEAHHPCAQGTSAGNGRGWFGCRASVFSIRESVIRVSKSRLGICDGGIEQASNTTPLNQGRRRLERAAYLSAIVLTGELRASGDPGKAREKLAQSTSAVKHAGLHSTERAVQRL